MKPLPQDEHSANDLWGYQPNAAGWGTPNEGQRLRAARLERRYRTVAKVCIWALLLSGFYMLGRNTVAQTHPVQSNVHFRIKAAALKNGTRSCELDFREDCLVCLHKDTAGLTTITSHC